MMMMMIRSRLSRYVTALIMALIITATSPARADENAFTGLRTGAVTLDGAPATRLVIEMQNPINASLFLLDNPYRVVLDVPNADWDAGNLLPTDSLDATGLASYRYGRPTANIGRLVFEMSGPYAPVRAFILPPRQSGGHRLVIDVQDNGRTAFSVAKAALKNSPISLRWRTRHKPTQPLSSQTKPPPTNQKRSHRHQGASSLSQSQPSVPKDGL